MPEREPSYSIAPTTDIVVIRDGLLGRMGSLMRWSLIFYWCNDVKKLPPLHTIRCEAIRGAPLVRKTFRQQRCLIPASGFYGTQSKADGTKQSFYIYAKDGYPFSFAGIWATAINTKGEQINSCSIITTPSNALMQPIQERMPAIVSSRDWDVWLNPLPKVDEALLAILKPFDPDQMELLPISSARDVANKERINEDRINFVKSLKNH